MIFSKFCGIFVCFCEFRGILQIPLKFMALQLCKISEALLMIDFVKLAFMVMMEHIILL